MKKVLKVAVICALVILYIYILGSGFLVGAYVIRGEQGRTYLLLYGCLAVVFPVGDALLYGYIWYLKKKIEEMEQEIRNLNHVHIP